MDAAVPVKVDLDVSPTERTQKYPAGDVYWAVDSAVATLAETRGPIERAKGMLMLIYQINADNAFEVLWARSQATNIKLRPLADQIIADILELAYAETLPTRSTYDHVLRTAHLRVGTGVAFQSPAVAAP
jgi:hypothetical protein